MPDVTGFDRDAPRAVPDARAAGAAAAAAASIVQVGRVLAALQLVTAFGHVSRRLDERSYEISAPGDLAELTEADTAVVDIAADRLPTNVPGEAWLHSAVYRRRPDVSAIVRAQPVSSFAAAAVTDRLMPLHGQGLWLGRQVPVFPVPRLVRSPELADGVATALGEGTALLLRANGAVTVGSSPAEAATRMWLLAMTCDVWLRAHAAGSPVPPSAEDALTWAAAAPPLLDRLWRHLSRTAMR